MKNINQIIIDSVIKKAEMICPDSLALIGIYGSIATDDDHDKSDLDLLILINDDDGWKLGCGFILDDTHIGYDIYCTNWESIQREAECNHAHLSKLLDSKIIYVKDQMAFERLEKIKGNTKLFLASSGRNEKAKEALNNAKLSYAEACLTDSISKVRTESSSAITYLLDAIMLFNGRYFKLGTKRTFEELASLNLSPCFEEGVDSIVKGEDTTTIKIALVSLINFVEKYIKVENVKEEPSSENISGSYEEMFSNWRNKVEEAAKKDNIFSSFMNLCFYRKLYMT